MWFYDGVGLVKCDIGTKKIMGIYHLAGAFVVYKTKFLYEMTHVCVFVHKTPNLILWSALLIAQKAGESSCRL